MGNTEDEQIINLLRKIGMEIVGPGINPLKMAEDAWDLMLVA